MTTETIPLSPADEALTSDQRLDPGLERALEVELAIDPDHTLPDVSLVSNMTRPQQRAHQSGRGSLVTENFIIAHNGQTVGSATIGTDRVAKERWFNGIRVNEPGKGFGTAAYKEAIEASLIEGYSFRTQGTTQSASAKNVWERLAGKGVARVVEPFVPNGDMFNGHYVVDAAQR
jgi:hypothetical protein